jgi:hypothetical protein
MRKKETDTGKTYQQDGREYTATVFEFDGKKYKEILDRINKLYQKLKRTDKNKK